MTWYKDRRCITYVKILENTGEDLRFLVGKFNPLTLRIEELPPTNRRKERRQAEDVLMRRKQSSFLSNHQGDDRRDEGTT